MVNFYGLNLTVVDKRKLIQLLDEAGCRYITMDELRNDLRSLLVSTSKRGMTDGKYSPDYLHWTSAHNAALEVLPLEARLEYFEAECLSHLQTQLSP